MSEPLSPVPETASLTARVARGAAWILGANMAARVLGALNTIVIELLAFLYDNQKFFESSACRLSFTFRPRDVDLVAPGDDSRKGKRRFDQLQVRVAFAQQLHHEVVARNADANVGGSAAGHRRTPSAATNVC